MKRLLLLTAIFLSGCSSYDLSDYGIKVWGVSKWIEPNIKYDPSALIPANFPKDYDPYMRTWVCSSNASEITLIENGLNSYILMDDLQIPAIANLDGLDRRWDWGLDGKGSKYAVVLNPNGYAGYYEFENNDSSKANVMFNCKTFDLSGNVKAKNIENWRKLNSGMTQDDVGSLLGMPLSIETNEFFIYWFYSDQKFHSKVTFDYKI